MSATQSVGFEIPETLVRLYKDMAVSPVMLLKNYALTYISGMIQKFDLENRSFEQKYHCTLPEFQARLDAMEDEEHFEWEDDVMDWEFAVENLRLWTQRKIETEAE